MYAVCVYMQVIQHVHLQSFLHQFIHQRNILHRIIPERAMAHGPSHVVLQKPRLPHSPELAIMSAQQNRLGPVGPSGPFLCKNLGFGPAMKTRPRKIAVLKVVSSALLLSVRPRCCRASNERRLWHTPRTSEARVAYPLGLVMGKPETTPHCRVENIRAKD